MLLTACASTTGPVTIRDGASSPWVTSSEKPPVTSTTNQSAEENRLALVRPVTPSQRAQPLPLVERLLAQASQQLSQRSYSQAINTAERGLRIDRKESRFYLVLAESYQQLGNRKQAVYFANQGLRYADVKDSTYRRLQSLAK